ncbi:hypothetical protein M5K25_024253 [Dendrobium thyrsiflorum]|uniref:Uncharacterized protein n=1 Tax=Dendrobium thyrsiflorum TaxID=117978 RepID=A0ABD0U1V9_DENTH
MSEPHNLIELCFNAKQSSPKPWELRTASMEASVLRHCQQNLKGEPAYKQLNSAAAKHKFLLNHNKALIEEDPVKVLLDGVVDLQINVEEGGSQYVYSTLGVKHKSVVEIRIGHARETTKLGMREEWPVNEEGNVRRTLGKNFYP